MDINHRFFGELAAVSLYTFRALKSVETTDGPEHYGNADNWRIAITQK